MEHDTAASAVKIAPPVAVSTWELIGRATDGITVPDIVMFLTLIYTALQLYVLIRDKIVRRKEPPCEKS